MDRYHLLSKLKEVGIGGLFLNAIKAMYTSIKYRIKLNDGLTRPIESSKGLQQGDLLSPMLFNLFLMIYKTSVMIGYIYQILPFYIRLFSRNLQTVEKQQEL